MRYMDQVWTDSNEVLVSVSVDELRLLREACEDSARRCTDAGGFTIRGMELGRLAADVFWVADQGQRELWGSQGA